jgi:hypothetical protein
LVTVSNETQRTAGLLSISGGISVEVSVQTQRSSLPSHPRHPTGSWAPDRAFSSDAYGIALLARDINPRLIVGPIQAITAAFKRGWTFEVKRQEQDRVLSDVTGLAKRYSARVLADQFQSEAIMARLRGFGCHAEVIGMTKDLKLAAFRERRDRLYDGSLQLPEHPDLFDELLRVKVKLEQGGVKIILPAPAEGTAI